MKDKVKTYIQLLRMKHYLKNCLIFIPAFFGEEIFQINIILKLLFGFIAFSFGTSFIYIINDIRDCEQDQKHEEKRNRPIAAGFISKKRAGFIGVGLLVMSVVMLFGVHEYAGLMYMLFYMIVNIAYSLGLKKIPIADVIILSSGFVIRIIYGASIGNIVCSSWLILTIMAVSLYLALGKRRNEKNMISDGKTRDVLKKYSVDFLDAMMHMCVAIGVIFYSLWSVDIGGSTQSNFFIWTIPIVIVIIMKYEMDIDAYSYGDPIEVLYKDKFLFVIGCFYALLMFIGKYVM
ncbi:MAG: UbiA prenyltransferase family protein [Lachnospiraceae bacterium]|nr:UbiA prenyltransferase family protein [Lachnospiraceae bacterium]